MPGRIGVDASSARRAPAYGTGHGVGADCSLIEATPMIETPAALASASAFARACFIAWVRAWPSAPLGSSTRKVIPSSVEPPETSAPSTASASFSRSRTVATTPLRIS